jgi:hypothetical protein
LHKSSSTRGSWPCDAVVVVVVAFAVTVDIVDVVPTRRGCWLMMAMLVI